jgi:hypothetical protein
MNGPSSTLWLGTRVLGSQVSKSANQVITPDSWQTETYDVEEWDSGRNGLFAGSGSRMTMKQTAYFLIVEHTHMLVSSNGWNRTLKNGAVGVTQTRGEQVGSNGQTGCVPMILQLNEGDYIENRMFKDHAAGGNGTLVAAADLNGSTFYSVAPVGI